MFRELPETDTDCSSGDAMDYLHYEFDASQGDVIEVTLDRAANVQLLDPANYENYKNGRGYRYHGGYATKSPVRLAVPETESGIS